MKVRCDITKMSTADRFQALITASSAAGEKHELLDFELLEGVICALKQYKPKEGMYEVAVSLAGADGAIPFRLVAEGLDDYESISLLFKRAVKLLHDCKLAGVSPSTISDRYKKAGGRSVKINSVIDYVKRAQFKFNAESLRPAESVVMSEEHYKQLLNEASGINAFSSSMDTADRPIFGMRIVKDRAVLIPYVGHDFNAK